MHKKIKSHLVQLYLALQRKYKDNWFTINDCYEEIFVGNFNFGQLISIVMSDEKYDGKNFLDLILELLFKNGFILSKTGEFPISWDSELKVNEQKETDPDVVIEYF